MDVMRRLWLTSVAALAITIPFKVARACDCSHPGDFVLWPLDMTKIEIALAWSAVPGATDYTLQRTASCDFTQAQSYALSPSATAYADTGTAPDDHCRFGLGSWCWGSTFLDARTVYTYRVRATLGGTTLTSNCITAQLATAPHRGIAGDLWADVVLGKPDFGQNVYMKTTAKTTQEAGGVVVDRHTHPNRVYVADPNRNRILGFDHLGTCAGHPCTTDADCAGGTCVLDYPNLLPAVVLGQNSANDRSGCNGDGTGQAFPDRAPAGAGSLCLIVPDQISVWETIFSSLMDVDENGALYVPDIYNNRILRYADPFTSPVPDEVLGQDDFTGNRCNKGQNAPDCSTLCLEARQSGVALDDAGNVWVADPVNARVLRFPRCSLRSDATSACSGITPGYHARQADVVLGQPDCTTNVRGGPDRPRSQFASPLDVAYDKTAHILYVADSVDQFQPGSRVLKFTANAAVGDFVTGMSGTRLPLRLPKSYPGTPPRLCNNNPLELDLDSQSHNLWIRQDMDVCTELVDPRTGRPSHTVQQFGGQIRGTDTDELGNLFVTDAWYGLVRLQRQDVGMGEPERVFGGLPDGPGGAYSADAVVSPTGAAVLTDPAGIGRDQLIIGDSFRMLIWNNYDINAIRSGQAADDLYGAPAFDDGSGLFQQFFYYPQVHGNQLWMEKGRLGELLVFDYPLCGSNWQQGGAGSCTQPSTPSRSIPVGPVNGFTGYPLLGAPDTKVLASPPDAGDLDFTVTPAGDAIWVADRWNNRVFRIANINGPGSAYVDIILGQPTATATQCNRGLISPQAYTLCVPYDVTIDANGNLFVGDNGAEAGTNERVLEFDAASLITSGTPRFGIPATRVYGTGGSFTQFGWMYNPDPLISPFKPILEPAGPMVITNNAYSAPRFSDVYLNPLQNRLPQMVLGDMTSYPAGSGSFDQNGNLYLVDGDWSRVLIYRKPFARISGCGNGVVDPGEECDDGNTDPTDGCTNACTICGNGVVSPGEECDDGNLIDGDGCSKSCTREGPVCGNGVVEADEECDDGNLMDGDGCSSRCTHKVPVCGNGVVEPGEECDDGNTDPTDGCTNACTICGNGVLSAGEQCDDGNLLDGDGCASDCTYELIPGTGSGGRADKRACALEWALLGPHALALDSGGRPSTTQTCRDNDPTCDFDPTPGICEFHVVACLNNVDPALPTCHPAGIQAVRINRPSPKVDPVNNAALAEALTDLRDPWTNERGLTPPLTGTRTDVCTAWFPLRVSIPPRALSKRLLVQTISSVSTRGARDVDGLTLVCTR